MSLVTKLSGALSMFTSRGLRGGLRVVSHRLYEEFQDRKLGIRTIGYMSSEELGHESPELLDYSPAPYSALHDCLARVSIKPGEDVLLDYGCGMGRVMVLAATKPFRRVLGVEISEELAAQARANIERAGRRLKCVAEVEQADARAFQVPDETTIIHLYNPFTGETLAQVVENILESLRRRPRELTIIFGNPGTFESMFGGQDWLKKTASLSFFPSTGYGIYHCRLASPAS
jgi:cyclopropane fatty-acyl-phospholipid synthase-like methyltransferase